MMAASFLARRRLTGVQAAEESCIIQVARGSLAGLYNCAMLAVGWRQGRKRRANGGTAEGEDWEDERSRVTKIVISKARAEETKEAAKMLCRTR